MSESFDDNNIRTRLLYEEHTIFIVSCPDQTQWQFNLNPLDLMLVKGCYKEYNSAVNMYLERDLNPTIPDDQALLYEGVAIADAVKKVGEARCNNQQLHSIIEALMNQLAP